MEIEDRGLVFKSWKSYAKFQEIEIKKLQRLVESNRKQTAFVGAVREAKKRGLIKES